jgi:Flp pilus assembly pilin Flp
MGQVIWKKEEPMKAIREMGKKLEVKRFFREEDGAGVVEVILILVVIIGLVLIFKEQLNDLVDNIFSKIQRNANNV